jgi:hypothetical protein
MLQLRCPACAKLLQVRDELAGKKARCPGCGTIIAMAVPSPLQRTPPAPAATPVGDLDPPSAADARTPPVEQFTQPPRAHDSDTTRTPVPDEPDAPAILLDFLAPPQAPDEIGRLGSYRVLDVLGVGGMGIVFRAVDPQLARPVALKAMLPALAANPTAKQRFLREAQSAAAVEHDHIVTIHEIGEDRGVPFLAMELLQGEPLDTRLKREPILPMADVLRIGREVAEALAAAHAQGLVHRDIKPANLWLESRRGRVKVLDFGLARGGSADAQLTQAGAIVGTPAYMAPEQAHGQAVDYRCDLFSLGCVLYRMTTGESPFHGVDTISTLVAVASRQPPPPDRVNRAVPAALSALIMALLAKAPAKRPASAAVVAATLARLAQPDVHSPPREAVARRTATRRVAQGIVGGAALGCAAMLLAICGGGYGLYRFLRVPDGGGQFAGVLPVPKDDKPAVLPEPPVKDLKERPDTKPPPVPEPNPKQPAEVQPAPAPKPADHRAVAEWVLSVGGRLVIATDDLPHKFVNTPKELPAGAIKVSQVILNNCMKVREGDLARLQVLSELDLLDVGGTAVTDNDLVRLRGMSRLRFLQLYSTKVGDAGLEHLQGLQRLESLNLARTQVTGKGLVWLRGLTRLNNLSLEGDQITNSSLAHIKDLSGLEVVGLRRTPITDDGLVHLQGLTRLIMLDLQGTAITGTGFVHLKDLSKLRCLDLVYAKFDDLDFPNLRVLANLNYMTLGGPSITGAGFGALRDMPNLAQLYLACPRLTDDGLARLRDVPRVRNLHLSQVTITGDGLVALKQQMTHLSMDGQTITDRIIPKLVELQELQHLGLQDTAVTDAGILELHRLSKLQSMYLKGAPLTREGIAALRKLMPKCKIASGNPP